MPDYDAGTASVRIRPNMDGFERDLTAELQKIRTRATVQVDADTDSAAGDLDRFRVEQEARPVKVRVESDRSGFDQVKRDLSELGDSAGGLVKLGVGFAGIGELPAAATAVASLTGVLQQLAGAGAAVPGVLGGVAASVGTVKLGLVGVEDAYKALDKAADGSAKNVAAANKALAALAPNAADAVRTAHDVADQITNALVKPVQNNLFAGVSTDLKSLVSNDLPVLQRGLGGISQALNTDLHQVLSSLGSDSSKGLLDRILGNTSDAETRFQKAIDPIIRGLGTITAAGSDALPRLADDLGRVADKFSAFITGADQDGSLGKFINDGITGVEQLGGTFTNVLKIVNDITSAAGGGQGLLGTLESATAKLDAFLKTPAGQQDLKNFFDEGKRDLAELLDLARRLPDILGGIFRAGQDAANTFLPVLKEVLDEINDLPGGAQTVADAFLAWKFAGVIKDVSTAVGGISTALGAIGGAAADAGAAGVAGLNPLLTAIATATAGIPVLFNAITPTPAPVRQPGESLDSFLDRTQKQGTYDPVTGAPVTLAPGQAPVAAKPGAPRTDTGDLLGAPPVAPPPAAPDPRQIAGPIPGPSGNPFAPGGALGGQPFIGPQIPSRRSGGPTPTGRPTGPTGGYIVEQHPDEWVLPAHARKAIGDQALWALTEGRSFAPGGYIDLATGNPITPGNAPGPAPATPFGGGNILGSLLGGLIPGLGASSSSTTSDTSKVGAGLFGLMQAGNDPDRLQQWGTQTADWLGAFTAKTVQSLGLGLWQGALGVFGLQDSILSPTNPYMQGILQSAGFFLGDDGPFGGGNGTSSGKGGAKAATPKQLREAQEKVADKNSAVQLAQQRLSELAPDAKGSTRASAQNELDKATREANDAKADLQDLMQYGTGGNSAYGGSSAYAASGDLPSAPSGSGAQRWAPVIQQALTQIGPKYGITNIPAWTNALVGQIQFESGGNPGALNPKDSDGQPAIGLGQFKQGTFAAHNVTGGDINDGVAQVYAMIDYVASRYGQDANGVPRGINQGHGYSAGGPTPSAAGPLPDGGYAAVVHPDEFMISARGRATVPDSFLHLLNQGKLKGLADGTTLADAAFIAPKPPNFQTPDVRPLLPHATPQPTQPTLPARHLPDIVQPAQPAPAPVDQQPPAVAAGAPAPNQGASAASLAGGGAAPSGSSHTLPGISKGITAGATAIGNIAASAAGAAGFGGGAAGPLIQGLATIGGKSVNDLADVFSAFGVGTVDQLGSTDRAYGYTAHPTQVQPDTYRPGGYGTYVAGIYGHNTQDVFRQLDDRESATRQGYYANLP